jgi:GPH family glycoside/pentoside/hexuronide:cation symporter
MNRQVNYLAFGAGSVANGVFAVVPGLLLMFYMTNFLGIDIALATVAVFAPKVVDVITDPMMGLISDRTRTRWGRRRPYMFIAALMIAPVFIMMFSAPEATPDENYWHVMGFFIAGTVTYTIFMVPYVTMTAEIAKDYQDRTVLNGYRMTYAMIGIVIGGACAPMLLEYGGGGREGYTLMAQGLGVVMMIAMLVTVFSGKEPALKETRPLVMKDLWSLLAKNPAFIILLSAYVLQVTVGGVLAATLPYFTTYVMGSGNEAIALIFLGSYGVAALTIPVWVKLSKHFTKLRGLVISNCISMIAALSFLLVGENYPVPLLLFQAALVGIGNGGQQLFAYSMMADAIVDGNKVSHPETDEIALDDNLSDGMMAGVFVAGEKMGAAVGTLVAGTLLGVVGLIETTTGSVDQSADTIDGIRYIFSIAPVILVTSSLFVIRYYARYEKKMQDIKV